MSFSLTIYPIRCFNLFFPSNEILTEDSLTFKENTKFLKKLYDSNILNYLPGNMKIEYRHGEEKLVTTKSLRGVLLQVGYSNKITPFLLNYLENNQEISSWDQAIAQFIINLPKSYPIIFNWS